MCLSWRDLLRNYPRPLCESPAVLKETILFAYLGLLFTDNCCKQAFTLIDRVASVMGMLQQQANWKKHLLS
jgi:hypothetical protein